MWSDHLHEIAVVVISNLIIFKKELTMKTLLLHLTTHLVVSLGLINAEHLLFNVGEWVASQG